MSSCPGPPQVNDHHCVYTSKRKLDPKLTKTFFGLHLKFEIKCNSKIGEDLFLDLHLELGRKIVPKPAKIRSKNCNAPHATLLGLNLTCHQKHLGTILTKTDFHEHISINYASRSWRSRSLLGDWRHNIPVLKIIKIALFSKKLLSSLKFRLYPITRALMHSCVY